MKTNKEKLISYIAKYISLNNRINDIIRHLYNHTELFEMESMHEYKQELFSFFAGKITRCSKEYNTIISYLTETEREKLKEIKIMEEIY